MQEKTRLLQRIISDPRFALAELILVVLSGMIWVSMPELGIWFTGITLLPWGIRILAGKYPFQRTSLDLLMAIFLLTAEAGYWAAYDKPGAWIKVWLIITAILLYFAISAQPKQNLKVLSLGSFCLGIGIAVYFFVTHNFNSSPGSFVSWWMEHRPQVDWLALPHSYISGALVITSLFAFYWVWKIMRRSSDEFTVASITFVTLGVGITLGAFVLTVSRGIWMAMACGLGVWMIWKVITSKRFASQPKIKSLFPLFVLGSVFVILLLAYLGPAQAEERSSWSKYGSNSRAALFEQSSYFLLDYPITGGGLDSFPGLYSQYVLGIPFFYFINSYNLFLDAAIEQGITGGLILLLIYLGTIWLVARTIVLTPSHKMRFLSWLGLFALIFTVIHGFFYDYLYNRAGTLFLFFPIGFSMIAVMDFGRSGYKFTAVFEPFFKIGKVYFPLLVLVPVLGILTILALNMNKIISIWYSNLGAVQMSQVELRYFPTNQWTTDKIVPQLEMAESSLRSAVQYNPYNRTANYRLGMISMLRQDFHAASGYLKAAYDQTPRHRGVVKNLGFSYVWLGSTDKAKALLEQIPEAQEELNAYAWWWDIQGRSDLSTNSTNFDSG